MLCEMPKHRLTVRQFQEVLHCIAERRSLDARRKQLTNKALAEKMGCSARQIEHVATKL